MNENKQKYKFYFTKFKFVIFPFALSTSYIFSLNIFLDDGYHFVNIMKQPQWTNKTREQDEKKLEKFIFLNVHRHHHFRNVLLNF